MAWSGVLSVRKRRAVIRSAASAIRTILAAAPTFRHLPPIVTIQAGHSKPRKEDVIIFEKSTAALLKKHLSPKMPTEMALRVLDKNSRTKVLRRDLEAARQAWLKAAPDDQTRAGRATSDFLLYQDSTGQ
jgi:hypothetical protein